MITLVSPCKECNNKGCGAFHDKCEPYQEFVAERKRLQEIKRNSKRTRRDEYLQKATYKSRIGHVFRSRRK